MKFSQVSLHEPETWTQDSNIFFFKFNKANLLFFCVYFQQQFVDSLLGCGLLLYVPRAWLSELFQLVISTDYLSQAGYHSQDQRVIHETIQ